MFSNSFNYRQLTHGVGHLGISVWDAVCFVQTRDPPVKRLVDFMHLRLVSRFAEKSSTTQRSPRPGGAIGTALVGAPKVVTVFAVRWDGDKLRQLGRRQPDTVLCQVEPAAGAAAEARAAGLADNPIGFVINRIQFPAGARTAEEGIHRLPQTLRDWSGPA